MNTGSMRIEPYAMCDADRHTGTKRFRTSESLGTSARYENGYGHPGLTWISPSLLSNTDPFVVRADKPPTSLIHEKLTDRPASRKTSGRPDVPGTF